MASGLVAKKIALFEVKPPQSFEQQCRLKRKHAIRRKKYRGKERRIVTREGTSMIALSTSDEHLDQIQIKDSDEDGSSTSSGDNYPHCSRFSASCSALFDLLSVESSDSSLAGTVMEDKTHIEITPQSKKLVLKSKSPGSGTTGSIETFSKRLNIIDIDIEIKIEKKEHIQESPSMVEVLTTKQNEEYEPLHGLCEIATGSTPVVSVTTDRIRLKASVDDSQTEKTVNYYCSKCFHDTTAPLSQSIKNDKYKLENNSEPILANNKVDKRKDLPDNLEEEPLYENVFTHVPPPPVSLGAPPLPPKRLFGDSFTTNYSCLPALYTKCKTKEGSLSNPSSGNKVSEEFSNLKDENNEKSKASSAVTAQHDANNTNAVTSRSASTNNTNIIDNNVTEAVLSQLRKKLDINEYTTGATAKRENATSLLERLCQNESLDQEEDVEEDEDEPHYEDLYDYCNGSESGNNELMKNINPILELFRDQLNSLEQNVEDEVEYCDCSTIMALMNTASDIRSTPMSQNGASESAVAEDVSSLKSYEIYDDCFGIGVEIPSNGENNANGNCDTSKNTGDHDDIGSLTKSGSTRSSHNLSEYIKSKVAKASTQSTAWRKVSSSYGEQTSNLNLLSMFPSLSKTKLVEPKAALEHNPNHTHHFEESTKIEASSSSTSPQVIAENERNVSKTRNANAKNPITYGFSYGLLKNCNNGNNKPRFGGRPVIAHPGQQNHVDEYESQTQDEDDREGSADAYDNNGSKRDNEASNSNSKIQSGDHAHKRNKKDDNEIFNKPLPLPPPNAEPYESVYEEPLYGITNQLTSTYSDNGKTSVSSGASPGKRRSSAPGAPFISNKLISSSKAVSNYSHSPSVSSGSTYGYSSGSVNEYGESKYGPSSCQTAGSGSMQNTPTTPSAEVMSIYGMSDKLPPTPPSKFSSIAKTAGRKIAKKFLGYRKTSKCGLEDASLSPFNSSGLDSAIGSGTSSPLNSTTSNDLQGSSINSSSPHPSSITPTNSAKVQSNGSAATQIRRPISRPSIPPPKPPGNEDGMPSPPPSLHPPDLPPQMSHPNYNIYDRKNDDDYEDSDFYDSDSELIRNFVSQVQPIYSMEEEPLYQYYTYGISLKPDDDYQPVIPKNLGLTLDMLVPRVGQRTLWCELPGVVSSGILSILSDKQKQLQEAIFEILTSEVSYLKSLDVLIALFYKNEELVGVLTEEERGYLFGNIEDVRDCSQAFLGELLGKWEESWYIQEIGEIISRNTETRFSVYKEYCRNKPYQDKTMQRLRHTRDEFVTVVKAIEEDEKCQMLQVDSFLMLPMQRITRLPLLVNAVIQRTPAGKEKNKCEEALKCLTNLVLACNDAARESQDAEETMAILEKLEFTRGIKSLPDLGQFIMKGDFMKNPFDQGRGNQMNWTFRKAKRTFYWLLLFSKQLLVARRKANGRFEIIDMVDPLESSIKALPNLDGVSKDYKHFFMLHFSRKETVYFLAARTNSEVERWKSKLEAMKPKEELRVEAIFPYDARRPDEMSFYVGDIIRVSQMQPDGWYFGTKLATGESGWFPGNYCCENAP